MDSVRPHSFLIALVAIIVSGIIGLVAFNMLIDPFRLFDIVSIDGVNSQRQLASSRARMAKVNRVCLLNPTSVVMGTSRVEVGVNPVHPGWHYDGRSYNLALPGMGISELSQTFQHLVHAAPNVREVAIGLDFLMFNAHREAVVFDTVVFDFEPNRLVLEDEQSCIRTYWHDAYDVLGPPASSYAISTIGRQMPEPGSGDFPMRHMGRWVAQYDENGYRGSYFRVILLRSPTIGFRGLFDGRTGDRAGQESGYVRRVWRPLPQERFCLVAPGQVPTLNVFQNLVELAHRSGVRVRFFINPVHARLLVALRESGLWPIYEDWKRGLVAVNETVAEAYGVEPLPIWDFSGFNTITTETVPEPGDLETVMQYWWEPSHYTEAAGTLLLDRLLGYQHSDRPLPDDYGVLLTSDTIEAWIAETRADSLDYVARHPRETEIVTAAVAQVMAGSEGSNCGFDVAAARDGSALLRAGDVDGAERAFDRAIELHEADARRYAELGVPYRETGFDAVLESARLGVTFEPRLASWRAYNQRGTQRVAAGDLMGALGDFNDAIRLAPPRAVLYQTRGELRLRLEDFAGAMADFQAGLAIEPESAAIQDRVDVTIRRMRNAVVQSVTTRLAEGDYSEAIAELQSALVTISADDVLQNLLVSALNQRAEARMEGGQYDGAVEDYSASLALDPDNGHIVDRLNEATRRLAMERSRHINGH